MKHDEAAEIKAGERPHKKIRHFGGLAFHLHGDEAMSKPAADNTANYWRSRGFLVHVVKEANHNEWLVYRRKKAARRK